jgi:streptogramin lyase
MNHRLALLLLLAAATVGCSAGTQTEEETLLLDASECGAADPFETPLIQRLVGPLPGFVPRAIVTVDDGIWFTESQGISLNHLSEDAVLHRLDAPFPSEWSFDAAVGADDNVWFNNVSGLLVPHVGRMSPDGTTTLFPIPSGQRARHVARGPDDAIWFTAGATIGRVSVDGAIAEIAGRGHEDRAGGNLRARRLGDPVRRYGRRGGEGQRHDVRAGGRRLDP